MSRVPVKREGWEEKTEGLFYLTPPLVSWPSIEDNPNGISEVPMSEKTV